MGGKVFRGHHPEDTMHRVPGVQPADARFPSNPSNPSNPSALTRPASHEPTTVPGSPRGRRRRRRRRGRCFFFKAAPPSPGSAPLQAALQSAGRARLPARPGGPRGDPHGRPGPADEYSPLSLVSRPPSPSQALTGSLCALRLLPRTGLRRSHNAPGAAGLP